MDAEDRLRLDYDRTNELIRTLIDGRLTMLALVPTVAGATVAVIGTPRPAAELLAVGLIGLIATCGILLYELRSTEVLGGLLAHAQDLECSLGLTTASAIGPSSVLLTSRDRLRPRAFGSAGAAHGWSIGLVYGAALGGWTYLVAWGALAAAGISGARAAGAVIGALVLIAVPMEVARVARRPATPEPARDLGPGPEHLTTHAPR